jgi:NADPH:quinone reductase-like Zn-dependent oxidoreductase
MKAAVLHQLGQAPRYEDFPDPIPQNSDQQLVTMRAAALKNLDKGRASGAHYAAHTQLPEVVGTDGVGLLPDGKRVYFMGLTGTMAEKSLADKNRMVPIPEGLDDATAAALPNAVFGAALALKFRAGMTPGKTVLVNGATGVTGKMAVQLAKYYGAAKVIATGRNAASLATLPALGADELISLAQEKATFAESLRTIHNATPIDIVIDYTWGSPMEWILDTLKGGSLHGAFHRITVVTVGSMAGEQISLNSGWLRSSAIEILGSGFGSLPPEAYQQLNKVIVPEALRLAAAGRLQAATESIPLREIEKAWPQHGKAGARRVVIM